MNGRQGCAGLLLAALSLPVLALGAPEQEELRPRLHQADRHYAAGGGLRAGYFEDEGLYVTLEAQANWKILLDRVIDGELDGAQMLAASPWRPTSASAPRPSW